MNTVLLNSTVLEKVVRISLFLTAALIPLFFLPFTLEVLELNKHFVLYTLVIIALLLWLLDAALRKKIVVRRVPFDLCVAGYGALMLIAGIFSIDRGMSFIGDYNNLQVGVLPLLFLLAFVFLITQSLRNVKELTWLLYIFLGATTVSGILFLLQRFAAFSLTRFGVTITNTVSISNAEFGVLMAMVLLSSILILIAKKDQLFLDVYFAICALVSTMVIISIGFKTVFIILAIGIVCILALVLTNIEQLRLSVVTSSFALLVITVLFIFLGSPSFLRMNLPVEVSLGIKESISIATDTMTSGIKSFLIGSGPATFVYDFSQYKPVTLNTNPIAWRIRFAEPYASAVAIITETGVVGALSFLFLILVVLGYLGTLWLAEANDKQKLSAWTENRTLLFLVAPLWIVLIITIFLSQLSLTLWFLFWMLTGVIASYLSLRREESFFIISLKSSPQYVLVTSFTVVLLFAGGVVFGVFAGRFYAAEVAYTRALKQAKSPNEQIALLTNATKLNGINPRYSLGLASAYLFQARRLSGDAKATPELINAQVAAAVNAAKKATDIAPNNVATWQTLSEMYINALPIEPGIAVWLSKSLSRAVELEPSNPFLRLQLGQAKLREGKRSEAKDEMSRAIELKQDYLEAYIDLARFYEGEKDYDKALAELQRGLGFGGVSNSNFMYEAGRLLFNRNKGNDWEIATASLVSALQLNPNNIDALFTLASLTDKQGNKTEALKLFQAVLERVPNDERVKKRVKQLSAALETE